MSAPDDRPPITVTRPDRDGRPTELLELGQDEPRQLPRWAKRTLVGAVVLAITLSVGSDLLDRWQAHRLAERQADALQLTPGQGGGGSIGGQVQFAVGLRNDGPLPVRLREPRLTAHGLEGIVGVTAPETVAPGAQADLVATVDAICPPVDLTATRVVVSVTAVAPSGRERRIELDVTALPGLLEEACRPPNPADELTLRVTGSRRVGAVVRVSLELSNEAGQGALTGMSSPLFRLTVRSRLPVPLNPFSTVRLELELAEPDCRVLRALPGGLSDGVGIPVDLVVQAGADVSGAGSGRGPRPDGSDPDGRAGLVVGRDLADNDPALSLAAAALCR